VLDWGVEKQSKTLEAHSLPREGRRLFLNTPRTLPTSTIACFRKQYIYTRTCRATRSLCVVYMHSTPLSAAHLKPAARASALFFFAALAFSLEARCTWHCSKYAELSNMSSAPPHFNFACT